MWLSRIEIEGFRNLRHTHLVPCNGYNLIIGANGSGKTSLLEALQTISSGRSFRTNKKIPIIQFGAEQVTIFVEANQDQRVLRVGLQKSRDGSTKLKLDGNSLESQSDLALLLPVLGSTPESDDLLSEGAKVRQAFLDWSLFHVEPTFREVWKQFRRVIHQRNRALKSNSDISFVRSWDSSLVRLGNEVDRLRKSTMSRLVPVLIDEVSQLLPSIDISFSYRQGWSKECSLAEALQLSLDSDRRMGFTHYGPHRADLVLKTEVGTLSQALSRGQKKMLTLALKIGQARDFLKTTQRAPIIYVDDLPAELDSVNRQNLLRRLMDLNIQFFVTATNAEEMAVTAMQPGMMFHVEQGSVTNVV